MKDSDHTIWKQLDREVSLAYVMLVVNRKEVCQDSWKVVEIPLWPCLYVLGMHTVYESANMGYCFFGLWVRDL